MDQPFVGAIFAHAGTFAPYGWKLCQGQVLSIAENDVLFSLLGTTYGGDGVQTFSLPDLRGRVPIGQGQGPGLNNYVIGQRAGTETVSVTSSQMPSHTHNVNVYNAQGTVPTPTSASYIAGSYTPAAAALNFYDGAAGNTTLSPTTVGTAGNSIPLSIIQPILAMNYIIALFGVYPSRN
jgi:microcystin-dependent protein